MNDPVDIAKANYLGELSAELLQVMLDSQEARKDIAHWTDLIMACVIAMRGVAAGAHAKEPSMAKLTDADVRAIVFVMISRVMALPADAWKIVEEPGPAKASYIPSGPRH